jgi:hypothetical protein
VGGFLVEVVHRGMVAPSVWHTIRVVAP